MKRWGYLIIGLLAVMMLSGKGNSGIDVAKLQPVETVTVVRKDGQIEICTDTGDVGVGNDLQTAVDMLKATTAAEIFLETAEYLLISEECEGLVPELTDHLRPSCAVCILKGKPEMESLSAFLRIHTPKVTLTEYQAGIRNLQTLIVAKGRMELVS